MNYKIFAGEASVQADSLAEALIKYMDYIKDNIKVTAYSDEKATEARVRFPNGSSFYIDASESI